MCRINEDPEWDFITQELAVSEDIMLEEIARHHRTSEDTFEDIEFLELLAFRLPDKLEQWTGYMRPRPMLVNCLACGNCTPIVTNQILTQGLQSSVVPFYTCEVTHMVFPNPRTLGEGAIPLNETDPIIPCESSIVLDDDKDMPPLETIHSDDEEESLPGSAQLSREQYNQLIEELRDDLSITWYMDDEKLHVDPSYPHADSPPPDDNIPHEPLHYTHGSRNMSPTGSSSHLTDLLSTMDHRVFVSSIRIPYGPFKTPAE